MAASSGVEYRHEALFSDVFEGLEPAEREALLEAKATTLVLDSGRIQEYFGTDSLERAVELLLEDLDPVLVWWAQRPEQTPLTIWWSQQTHKVEPFTPNEPLWLAFSSTGGRFADRALRVVQKTRAFMTAEMAIRPLADGMKLKAAMLGPVLHIFANADAQGMSVPPDTAENFVDRVSKSGDPDATSHEVVQVDPVVARALVALGTSMQARVIVRDGHEIWEARARQRFVRIVTPAGGADPFEARVNSDDLRRLAAIPSALCRPNRDTVLATEPVEDWPWPSPGKPGPAPRISAADLAVLHGISDTLPQVDGWQISGLGPMCLAATRAGKFLVELVFPAV